MKNHTLRKKSALLLGVFAAAVTSQASTDYGPAFWRPPCNGNYNTSGSGHKFHVVHDMEGYYWSVINMFNACGYTSASVHYLTNGKKDNGSDAAPGEVTQSVRDTHYAWHARCWNGHSTGTEHEGFVSNPAWYTAEQYQASAGVTRHLSNKFGWAKDRNHVIGHDQKRIAGWPAYASGNLGIDPYCNDHTDPGLYWDWGTYMSLINAGSTYVPGDFVEDGKTDCALWNPSNGQWNIRSSINADVYTFTYGLPGDVPLIGHISSPSRAEAGIYRPSTGTWFWRHGVTGNTIGSYVWGGQAGDIPLVGAWTGRLWDAVIFRAGTWYVRFGDSGNTANFQWGQAGDIPMIGDILGDGMVDQVVFRPSNGMWYWRSGETGNTIGSYTWGQNGDIPMVGAWSGRMRDAVVFRPSTGRWYIRFGDTGNSTNFEFGQNGDTPMVGNFFGNGMKDQAVYRQSTGQWWIRNGVTGAVSSFAFGSSVHMAVSE